MRLNPFRSRTAESASSQPAAHAADAHDDAADVGPYRIHQIERLVYDDAGRRFDPRTHRWTKTTDPARGRGADLLAVATWLQRESGHPRRMPVGVMGNESPSPGEIATATHLGRALARMGLAVLVVSRGEIAAAACKGAADADGDAISLVGTETDAATIEHATITLPCGLAANAVFASAPLAIVTIGEGCENQPELVSARATGATVIPIKLRGEVDETVRGAPLEPVMERLAARVMGI